MAFPLKCLYIDGTRMKVASVRKDELRKEVELNFGSLKARFRILKTGIIPQNQQQIDKK
jgi:hypothetical protein